MVTQDILQHLRPIDAAVCDLYHEPVSLEASRNKYSTHDTAGAALALPAQDWDFLAPA